MGQMTDDGRIDGLILRIARGDRQALAAVYALAAARLHGLALHILQDPQRAGTALADVFVALWQTAPGFRDSGLPAGVWLVTLARDVVVADARAGRGPASRDDLQVLADLGPDPLAGVPDGTVLAGSDPDRAEALRRVWLHGEDAADLGRRFGMPADRLRGWLRRDLLTLAGAAPSPTAGDTAAAEDSLFAAEFVLGLLPAMAARDVALRCQDDPELRRACARVRVALAALADQVAPEPPPPACFAEIELRLFPEDRQGWLARLGVVPAILGALAAALLALAFAAGGG